MNIRPRKRGAILAAGLAILCIVALLNVGWGAVTISPLTILAMAGRRLGGEGWAATWPAAWETVIFDIRLPRIVLAALVGGSLALAGAVYQGLFRNPLADPYLLGISAGAGLGATIAIAFGVTLYWSGLSAVSALAFVGGLGATLLVYLLAQISGRLSPVTLLLAGVALGAFLTAITTFLMFYSRDAFQTVHIVGWLMGSLALANWSKVGVLGPALAIGGSVMWIHAHRLNILQLDDEQAQQLGVPVERTRIILSVAASLTTSAAVAVSGIIGFVGLIVPHAVRLVWGPDHRFLLPMSAISGAIFMIVADGLARGLLAPTELPVGVVTAFCGAPFFLYLLRHRQT